MTLVNSIIKRFDNRIKAYLSILLALIFLYYILCFVFGGSFLDSVFLVDKYDSYMDYFNSISNARYNPYDLYSNQPALVKVFYRVLLNIVPKEEVLGSGLDFRSLKSAQIGFMLYNIIIGTAFVKIICENLRLLNKNLYSLLLIVFLSAPFMFTFERGNIIWLALVLTMFFVFNYDSDNKLLRELAYISLAFAAGIKLYPAVFGLLLLSRTTWKAALRTIFYGLIIFIIPFYYYDGLDSLKVMIQSLMSTTNTPQYSGLGINVSLLNLCKMFTAIYNIEFSMNFYRLLIVIVLIVLLVSFFLLTCTWKRLLSLSLLTILLPNTNYYYALIFLVIPFIVMLNDDMNKMINFNSESILKTFNLYWIPFGIIWIPWYMGLVEKLSIKVKFVVSYGMVLNMLALVFMIILLAINSIEVLLKTSRIKYRYLLVFFGIFTITTLIFTFI